MVATVGGAAYFMLSGEHGSAETIKIGVCADIDFAGGKAVLQGAILAAEQLNAEGGVLGRNITIVAEDDDTLSGSDPTVGSNALTKLITVDEADFILTSGIMSMADIYQEIVAEHKKILFHYGDNRDALAQKVLDDYDRYKYYFRLSTNETAGRLLSSKLYAVIKEHTELNKVAVWQSAMGVGSSLIDKAVPTLTALGFDVVHTAVIPSDTIDFTSYFAQAEANGAEIIIPWIYAVGATIPLVKEYNTRQSPTVLWNVPYIASPDSWEMTDGKCNYITSGAPAVSIGYPLTSHVIPTREAYFERWGEELNAPYIAFAYDVVRFILPDAIERAGTIETDAVIAALENTAIKETSLCKDLAFTASHDLLITDIEEHRGNTYFQWQNGELVIVYPKELMEEAGATYIFPDWPGPWD